MTEQTEAQRLAHILTTQSTLSEYQQDEAAAELLRLDAVEQAYNLLLEKTYAQPASVPDLTHDQLDQWQNKHSLLLGRDALDELRSMLAVQPATAQGLQRYSPDGEGGMEVDSLGAYVKHQDVINSPAAWSAPAQEPVAWIRGSGLEMLKVESGGHATVYASDAMSNYSIPLYTAQQPAQRKPLTDAQIHAIDTSEFWFEHTALDFARAIEAAHGITEVKQ